MVAGLSTTNRIVSVARSRMHVSKNRPRASPATADRDYHRLCKDDYTQTGNLYRLPPADEKQRLFRKLAAAMQGVPQFIIERELMD